ncbi:hypothetical protein chiPu_0012116 [Chiloscyllium punctatum]|uniref:Uncharacterized protein n=1 Tax=Chiloscyllium punctatum TaxID=137246 RepID=A0A401STE8_CHIPU|nr:hypothetical protein [Chiloscyllium punctatum]
MATTARQQTSHVLSTLARPATTKQPASAYPGHALTSGLRVAAEDARENDGGGVGERGERNRDAHLAGRDPVSRARARCASADCDVRASARRLPVVQRARLLS